MHIQCKSGVMPISGNPDNEELVADSSYRVPNLHGMTASISKSNKTSFILSSATA